MQTRRQSARWHVIQADSSTVRCKWRFQVASTTQLLLVIWMHAGLRLSIQWNNQFADHMQDKHWFFESSSNHLHCRYRWIEWGKFIRLQDSRYMIVTSKRTLQFVYQCVQIFVWSSQRGDAVGMHSNHLSIILGDMSFNNYGTVRSLIESKWVCQNLFLCSIVVQSIHKPFL